MKPTKKILEQYHIQEYFTSLDIPMEMKRYEKGDLLVRPQFPTHNLILILRGKINIYNYQEDGTTYSVTINEKCQILGDVEFVNNEYASDYVEAVSDILTIEIPMDYCRSVLKNDPKFLNFLLKSIVGKMELTSYQVKYLNMEDKVLRYFQSNKDNELSTVGQVANMLHISRRQLQRILKKFCEDGTIVKLGKGQYKLIKEE